MVNKNNIGWLAHPQFIDRAKVFEKKYQMINCIVSDELAFRKKRVDGRYGNHCLFCGQNYPEVTFNNAPHLLSRMVGSNLYSDFECDNCNALFSKFETDLSSYLGLGRSITGLYGAKKVPGFPGIGIEAKSFNFKGNKISVIHKENAESNIDSEETKLKYGKPSYTPSNVYRLLVKWGLSILSCDEVKDKFKKTLHFLKNDNVLTGSHISVYRYPLSVTMPLHAYIFKKKKASYRAPTYVVSFYFDYIIITLPLPLHHDDMKFFGEDVDMPIAPPYFIGGNDMDQLTASTTIEDLSSPLRYKNEPEEMTMKLNKLDVVNAVFYNPKTGEKGSGYNPAGSKYMIATEHGVTYTKEELKELIAAIEEKFAE